MNVRVAISKRRAKRLAAGVITRPEGSELWLLLLYSVADDRAIPFGMQQFETLEEALSEANDALRVAAADWLEIDEGSVEQFITSHTRNRWSVS
jgi:hypothetical protein